MKNEKRNLEKVLHALEHHDISTIPSVLARILAISRNPMSNATDLAKVCQMDKATSARLLRAANSIYYATESRQRVDNIQDAIVRIGFRTAEEIILSSQISTVLRSDIVIDGYSSSMLWKHSVAVGIGSRLILSRKFGPTGIDPFVAGLLHDLGIALEHQFLYADGFREVISQRLQKQSLLIEAEAEILGVSHEELGEVIAKKWNFPDHLTAIIGHHHNFAVDEKFKNLIHVIRLSEYLCFQGDMGYSDFSESHAEQLRQSKDPLGISENEMTFLAERLNKEIKALSDLGWFSELRLKPR